MGEVEQQNFGAGIFRGRVAPRDSVYDAVNAIVDDELALAKRGDTVYESLVDTATAIHGLASVYVATGERTILWEHFGSGLGAYTLRASDGVPVEWMPSWPTSMARGVGIGGFWIAKLRTSVPADRLVYYAGQSNSLLPNTVSLGPTATLTNGSKTVTLTAGSFGATAQLRSEWAGAIITDGWETSTHVGIIESVQSTTSATLREPWAFPTIVATVVTITSEQDLPGPGTGFNADSSYLAAVGAVARLLVTSGNKVYFSDPGLPTVFGTSSFHELPGNALIVGADAIQDAAVIFTTAGVWTITNMDLDPVDATGNVQHQVSQINKDLVLWNDSGISSYAGGLVVPAIDDVYLMDATGAAIPVSQAIRPLYRGYVKAGYRPGLAAVHRGRYILPVLDAVNNVVDTLTCRLDLTDSRGARRPAWTRWSGHASGRAYAGRVGGDSRTPQLFGVNGLRVTDLTGCFDAPVTGADADGTTPTFTVETNDFDVSAGPLPQTVTKLRVEYEVSSVAAPAIAAAWASGPEGSAYTTMTATHGGVADDGSGYSQWRPTKSRKAIRFRIRSTSTVTKLILRSVGLTIRETGRR